jgi:hypothetical protein
VAAEAGDEAAWRELVARFESPPGPGPSPAPWPSAEDLPGAAPRDGGLPSAAPRDGGLPGRAGGQPGPDGPGCGLAEAGLPPSRVIRPAADEEHYVPPVPPPLPRLDPASLAAWTALLGGPVYLLVAVSAGWQVPGLAAFGAVAAFVGGFAAIVMRLGDSPPGDGGPDDGAVV